MSVYDRAHELAKALSSSEEFLNFRKALEKLKEDAKAFEMFQDFRKKELEIQTANLTGLDTEAQLKNLENLFSIITYNKLVRDFFDAEARFATMVADVQKIIGQSIDVELN